MVRWSWSWVSSTTKRVTTRVKGKGIIDFSLVKPKAGRWLSNGGLVIQGIEIRPKIS